MSSSHKALSHKEELDSTQLFMSFDGLDSRLTKAVAKCGFVHPTLVQSKSIPLALAGKDLLVRARTGSGKTAAYSLPMLAKILQEKGTGGGGGAGGAMIRGLVLVPTRELCQQVHRQIVELTYYCKDLISVGDLGGGSSDAQRAVLQQRPDILVTTPGRIVAHLTDADLVASLKASVGTLVIDEADLVLSYGYEDDVRSVVRGIPRTCQTFVMSATLSEALDDFRKVILHQPVILRLEEGSSDGKLSQWFVSTREGEKELVLYALLKLNLIQGKTLFFVNSVNSCYRLKLLFDQFSVQAAVVNAELPSNSRQHIIEEFNKGVFDFLIATDEVRACGNSCGVRVAFVYWCCSGMRTVRSHTYRTPTRTPTHTHTHTQKRHTVPGPCPCPRSI